MDTGDGTVDEDVRTAAAVTDAELATPQVAQAIALLLTGARQATELDAESPATGSTAVLVDWLRPQEPGTPVAPRRLRRRAAKVGAVSLALVLAGTGAAAATGALGMHTGFFGGPGMTENDTSEFLDTHSPEVDDLLLDYARETPPAPGYPYDRFVTAFHVGDDRGLMQADGLRGFVADVSRCTWEKAWLTAHDGGDAALQAQATQALQEVPSWPIIARIDGDGGMARIVAEVAAAAAAGNREPIQREFTTNCGTGWGL